MSGNEESKGLTSAFDSPTFNPGGSFSLDKPVGSASISPCGRDVVLASREGLDIIDLDSPWSPPRHLPHLTPWEVADVQWSPFAARDSWVVSTSNQKALVWNLALANTKSSVEHVLHAHSRAITDINFSAHHPDILATCAVDSFVHCWDLRHPSRPAMTFCDWFAGATQVKFNRQSPHLLASSHDKFLRIWDDRKGAFPLRSIEAHATKIYGVDWSRMEENHLVTCSLDRTIKFWDYLKDVDEPDHVIHASFPVWRARHTPFGYGLLAMPQRGDHDLHLYDRRNSRTEGVKQTTSTVHKFGGHDDQVKEFLWRPRGIVTESVDDREFQLVSWGTDRILRLHQVSEDVLREVGYKKGMQVQPNLNITRRNAAYKTFRDIPNDNEDGGPASIESLTSGHQGRLGTLSTLTAGMSRAPVPFIGGFGNRDSVYPMMGRKSAFAKEMDAISWMRGVKIGKRESSPSGVHQSVSSIHSPSAKTDTTWDVFESLGEEITNVADKFSKVTFDEIDVQRRRIAVTLAGPWGPEKSSTYIRVRVEFPPTYPTTAALSLSLERTAAMTEETKNEITSGILSIASSFVSRQRSSLEAIFRFLLGEQSLEESLLWLKKRQGSVDIDSTQDLDLSSSDEDDDGLGRYPGPQADNMETNDALIAESNAQYNVPLQKVCGALWADDGRLVCFFPLKQDKELSLLGLSLKGSDRSARSRRTIFEGFGRMHNEAGRQKRTASTLETIQSGDSDFDDASTSSSGTSTSSDHIGLPPHHFMPSMAWRGDISDIYQGIAVQSQRSSGDTGQAKSTMSRTNNCVTIHDFSNLLPARKILAQSYYILEGPKMCAHNARVANETGHIDLADVWSFVALILQDKVPLESKHFQRDSQPVFLRNSTSNLRTKGKASLPFHAEKEKLLTTPCSVNWSNHPFGRRWFVDSLLHNFEQAADIQMLAMLVCVFSDLQLSNKASRQESHQSDPDFGAPPLKSTGDYLSSRAKSHPQRMPSELSVPIVSQKHISESQSTTSSTGPPLSDLSTSQTPPSDDRTLHPSSGPQNSQALSLSSSPEHYRHTHRSNSNLSALAASFSRSFSFRTSAASSPPNTTYLKKRSSPVGSYLGNPSSAITWSSSIFSKSSTITEGPRSTFSLSVSDTEEDTAPVLKWPGFRTTLKHRDHFHHDGHSNIISLDPTKRWRYRAYQEAYAHLLYIWNMPTARAEMLKYNHYSEPPESSSPFNFAPKPAAPTIATASAHTLDADHSPRPVFRDHCPSCFNLLPLQSPSRRCQSCSRPRTPLFCILCTTIIRGLSSPCSNCGHVLHASCRQLLFSESDAPITECPSGCGCVCANHSTMQLPAPIAESNSGGLGKDVSPAVTVIGDEGVNDQEELGWKENGEDVAYESLARNLMPRRKVRAKGSRIWRGRKGSR